MAHGVGRSFRAALFVFTLATVVALPIHEAGAVNLSGTIRYTGSRGPVSVTLPIRLSVHSDANFDDNGPTAEVIVTTSPGDFALDLPEAGTYYLAYWLDINNDDRINLGEPAEIYNNKVTFPGDAITVGPSGLSGLSVDFGDTLATGIRGSATYSGDQGGIFNDFEIRVHAFTDANLTNPDPRNDPRKITTNGGRYEILTLDGAPRYLLAFVDLNHNKQFDSNEPFEIYNKRGAAPGDPVTGATDPPDTNFVFGDQPPHQLLTGTINYTGTHGPVSSATPIVMFLFSDRNGNSAVDQAILGTNGSAFALGASTAGNYYLAYVLDLNGDGDASVGEPAGFFNGRTNFSSADAVAVPRSGLAITFGDSFVLPGVGGWVRYDGQGQASSQNRVIVELFTDSLLQSRSDSAELEQNGDRFSRFDFITLDTKTYYLRACYDANGNGQCDSGEPSEVYNNKGSGQGANPIVAGGNQGAITIEFGDQPPAAHLSGTVTYTGHQGPVSSNKPIAIMFVGDGDNSPKDAAGVATSPGAFDLAAATSGNYNFAYFLDVNDDGSANVGESFEVYNNRFDKPFDTVAVPSSGVNVSFDDTGLLPGIGGTVTYNGHQGRVSPSSPLRVEAYTDPSFSSGSQQDDKTGVNGGRYDLITVGSVAGPYYLRAFLDLNNNGSLDPGEPFDIFNGKRSGQAPDAIPASSTQTAVNILVTDDNLTLGTPTPTHVPTPAGTPTSTPTPTPIPTLGPCVGDCDHNGRLTVDELVTGVNIALGNATLDQCSVFDCNGNQHVTVDCLVKAVNAALNGCIS